jgi:hypothetical protein
MFLAQMRVGSALSVMISHGWARSAYSMQHEGKRVSLDADEARALARGDPVAPLVVIACSTGSFDDPHQRCLAEEFLLQPGGPVVTIGASAESHPLPNTYTAMALVSHMAGPERTVGDWWLAVEQSAAKMHNPVLHRMLLNAEGSVGGVVDAVKLSRDQMLMYNLLGDPACRRFLVEPLQVKLTREAATLMLEGELPAGCDEVTVEMLPARAGMPSGLTATEPGEDQAQIQRRNFELVNAQPVTLYRQRSPERDWRASLTLPDDARAESPLRIIALGKDRIWACVHTPQPAVRRAPSPASVGPGSARPASQAGDLEVAGGVEAGNDVLHRGVGLDDVAGEDHEPAIVATVPDEVFHLRAHLRR